MGVTVEKNLTRRATRFVHDSMLPMCARCLIDLHIPPSTRISGTAVGHGPRAVPPWSSLCPHFLRMPPQRILQPIRTGRRELPVVTDHPVVEPLLP